MNSTTRKRAVILHGKPGRDEYFDASEPSSSNRHWIPWLQKQLLTRGYDAQAPEVVDSYAPDYTIWSREFERHLVDSPMVLVGHSCGGGFLVRWLSEHPDVSVDTLVLVAPWFDPNREDTTTFFDFEIDPSLADRVEHFHLFTSSDDGEDIHISENRIVDQLPNIEVHQYDNMGHFCFRDLGTDAFPDLLNAVLGTD